MSLMAPQGFMKHRNSFEADLFSLPVAAIKTKKRKSKELNPNAPVFKRKKEKHTPHIQEPEIITIDSDHEAEKTIPSVVTVSDSDTESVKICEATQETIEVNDSEADDCNLIININQTENVDIIVDSALGRRASNCATDHSNNVAKKSDIKQIDWTQVKYPKAWTSEMIRFYFEPCDDKRNFDHEKILNKLRTKPSDWWINRADMMGVSSRRRRSFEVCRNCDKFGHTTRDCQKNTVCYVCGGFNHKFPNCPNTLCFTCGKPTSRNLMRCESCDEAFNKQEMCGLCRQTSHEEFMCPSKWRKHLLLDPSDQSLQLNPKRCCYNCAQKGHFGFDCPFTQNSAYPLENPLLTSYHTDHNMNNVVFVPGETADLLKSDTGNIFFKRMSDDMKCRIEFCEREQNPYIRIVGNEDQVRIFKDELEKLKLSLK